MEKLVKIDEELLSKNPEVCIGQLEADVIYSDSNVELNSAIKSLCSEIELMSTEGIKEIQSNEKLRKTYKACGKAPSRYRSSCEAMMRRVIQGKGLYQVNTLVDVGNYISLHIKNSIGLYDLSSIQGDIIFRIGQPKETYTGIGRYELNMEGMPLVSDDVSAFGSPTSDSERTAIRSNVKRIILLIYSFNGKETLMNQLDFAKIALEQYCQACNIKIGLV